MLPLAAEDGLKGHKGELADIRDIEQSFPVCRPLAYAARGGGGFRTLSTSFFVRRAGSDAKRGSGNEPFAGL